MRKQLGGSAPVILMRLALLTVILLLLALAGGQDKATGGDFGFSAAPTLGDCPRVGKPFDPPLHLQRFEDGSAYVKCGRRIIARVSVPW